MLKTGVGVLCVAFCLIFVSISGCGGGGETSSGSPVLQGSLPPLTIYDFGDVTPYNFPAAKVITLSNSGTAPLKIFNIELTDAGFILDLASGENFCGSTTPTIAVGGSCALAVGFGPTTVGPYSGTLSVSSNDPDTPRMDIGFIGTGVAVAVPIVHINQVEPDVCPSDEMSIYLSVTDQEGYPISGLETTFTLSETFNGVENPITITSQNIVGTLNPSISVALVMDYSGSITADPDVLAAMVDGVVLFINRLGVSDTVEIVKFASEFEVVQPFTAGDATGRAILIGKVMEPWDGGRSTRLNDAIYQAVDDVASQLNARRAVILVTDGVEDVPELEPSTHSYSESRDYAIVTGVPVFTVGIGNFVDQELLDSLASDTGGQYFGALVEDNGALVEDNLSTIYKNLAQILFVDQYVLTYDSEFDLGASVILKAEVMLADGTIVEDSRNITVCPLP